MRIILDGDISKAQAWVKFTCPDCGCVFEAQKGEYRQRCENKKNGFDRWFYADCPCCKREVSHMKPFRRNKAQVSVYPTWWSWLINEGVIEKGSTYTGAFDKLKTKPIPADIAKKLGVQPKEG